MPINLTNQETKEFLIAKIRTLQFGEEQTEEVIIDNQLKEGSEWQNKLCLTSCLKGQREHFQFYPILLNCHRLLNLYFIINNKIYF